MNQTSNTAKWHGTKTVMYSLGAWDLLVITPQPQMIEVDHVTTVSETD